MASLFGPISALGRGYGRYRTWRRCRNPCLSPALLVYGTSSVPRTLCPHLRVLLCPQAPQGPQLSSCRPAGGGQPQVHLGKRQEGRLSTEQSLDTAGSTRGLVTHSPEYVVEVTVGDFKVGSKKPMWGPSCMREPLILRAGAFAYGTQPPRPHGEGVHSPGR